MHAAWGSWLIPLRNGVAMKVPSKNFFLSTLKLKSKHPSIPEATSMARDPSSEPADMEVEFKHHHQLKSFNCSIGTSCRYLHLTLSLVIQLTRCTLGLMLTLWTWLSQSLGSWMYWSTLTQLKLPVLMKSWLGFWRREHMRLLHPYVSQTGLPSHGLETGQGGPCVQER